MSSVFALMGRMKKGFNYEYLDDHEDPISAKTTKGVGEEKFEINKNYKNNK